MVFRNSNTARANSNSACANSNTARVNSNTACANSNTARIVTYLGQETSAYVYNCLHKLIHEIKQISLIHEMKFHCLAVNLYINKVCIFLKAKNLLVYKKCTQIEYVFNCPSVIPKNNSLS